MEAVKSLCSDMGDWLSSPFKRDMPISQLLLIFVLFLIVAFIVYDMLRILKSWMDAATEVAVDAVS
jgi:hypothetical protein